MDESGDDNRGDDRELPSGTHLVCPRCGATAGDSRWCAACGLNLSQQGKLPTADAYAAGIRERRWLAEQETQRRDRLMAEDWERRLAEERRRTAEERERVWLEQQRQRDEEERRRRAEAERQREQAEVQPEPDAAETREPEPDDSTSESDQAPKPDAGRRRRLVIAAGALVALVLAGLAVAFFVVGNGESSVTVTDAAATTATTAPTPTTTTVGGLTTPTVTSTATATVTRTNTAAHPQPTIDTGGSPPSAAAGPDETLRQHYQYLDSGRYEESFALMAASFRAQNPGWVADRRAGDPRIDILSIGAPRYSSGTARVSIDFIARDRRGSDTSCREFRGAAALIMEHGAWRYEPGATHYESNTVPASEPSCAALA